MATLVAVSSEHGSTREIAEHIVSTLREKKGVNAVLVEIGDAQPLIDDVEAIVVAAPIYHGEWAPEASRFVLANQAEFGSKSLFLVASGIAPVLPGNVAQVLDTYNARSIGYFQGNLDATSLSDSEKSDFDDDAFGDYRDWNAIEHWAQEIFTHGAV